MAINFNIRSVLESAAKCEKDSFTASIDDILSSNDLEAIIDKTCPITGEVAATLKAAAADPKQLKIVKCKKEQLDEFYIDYNEFVNFCEANNATPAHAVAIISEAYESEGISMTPDQIHIVFPQASVMKEACACCKANKVGYSADVVWSSKLLKSCINAGLKTNTMYPKKEDAFTKKQSETADSGTVEVEET